MNTLYNVSVTIKALCFWNFLKEASQSLFMKEYSSTTNINIQGKKHGSTRNNDRNIQRSSKWFYTRQQNVCCGATIILLIAILITYICWISFQL